MIAREIPGDAWDPLLLLACRRDISDVVPVLRTAGDKYSAMGKLGERPRKRELEDLRCWKVRVVKWVARG